MEANIFIVPEELIYIYFRLSQLVDGFLYRASLPTDLHKFIFKTAFGRKALSHYRQTPIKLCKLNLKLKLIFHDFQFYRLAKL